MRKTTVEFIKDAIKIHGDKYSYSSVDYITNKHKVDIICKEHGIFKQRPDEHLRGLGCKYCANNYKKNTEIFIKLATKKHGNKYDYSLCNYINTKTKIKIICTKHGVFEQTPSSHLRGASCSKCKGVRLYTTNEFIESANIVHNNIYYYSQSIYINSHTKLDIICPTHGIFQQKPYKHLNGQGCPTCKLSKGIKKICNILNTNNIKYEKEVMINGCISNKHLKFDLYIPNYDVYIEYDGEQHFRQISSWGGTSSFLNIINRDKIKDRFCKSNNIKLYRISYLDNIDEQVKNILNL